MTKKRKAYFLSDATGVTAETMGNALLSQFAQVEFERETVPFIDSVDKAHNIVVMMNAIGREMGARPLVFSTVVRQDIRGIIRAANAHVVDLVDSYIGPLEKELKVQSSQSQGNARNNPKSDEYKTRIDAINYALSHDDGQTRSFNRADVVLCGVSRSGKTPTTLYLAMNHSLFAANYPLTPDDLDSYGLPTILTPYRQKLIGLTIEPERLSQIRQQRRPDSVYASLKQCTFEVHRAEALYKSERIPFFNTTTASVEEIASRVRVELKRK